MKISDIATASQLTDEEYLPVWTALMETARGRRFLSEFARRTRTAETRTLLESVHKLESALVGARQNLEPEPSAAASQQPPASDDGHHLRVAITQAVPELETVARINTRAMADLQDAADEIHAAAKTLRAAARASARHDDSAAMRACDAIDLRVTDIDEIIAVQQISDARTLNVGAHLAELVGAPPNAEATLPPAHDRATAHRDAPAGSQTVRGATRTPAQITPLPPTAEVATAANMTAMSSAGSQEPPVRSSPDQSPSQSPAIQQLIQEITTRLLNGQDNGAYAQRDFG